MHSDEKILIKFNDGRDWFFENRFGLFIHWGLYAIPAWHEQIQWRKNIAKSEYEKLVDKFNPVKFDPDVWMKLVMEAGMNYICITTKHHDGFCMWDTNYTDFNIMNTPYKKDILKMLANACNRHEIKLCLYYSCPDWHHHNATNQGGDHQLKKQNPGDEPDEDKYIAYVKNQVAELCTNYGKIYGLFWDIQPNRRDPSINKLVRKLQPGIIINDRGWDKGDYNTPERCVPEGKCFIRATEACQSVGQQSWGYRDNEDYYSHKFIMQSIAKVMAMGGNYLLNVGPRADGTIPAEAVKSIRKVGKWYKKVREAITSKPFSEIFDTDRFMATRDGNNIYIHFYNGSQSSGIVLKPFDSLPRKATVLNTGQELATKVEMSPRFWQSRPFLHIRNIPVNEIQDEVIVLKIEFDALDNQYLGELSNKNGAVEFIY